jgi:hypothetical protein
VGINFIPSLLTLYLHSLLWVSSVVLRARLKEPGILQERGDGLSVATRLPWVALMGKLAERLSESLQGELTLEPDPSASRENSQVTSCPHMLRTCFTSRF